MNSNEQDEELQQLYVDTLNDGSQQQNENSENASELIAINEEENEQEEQSSGQKLQR